MSDEIKRQHFLPFAYLKNFRVDAARGSRGEAMIFRDDGTSVTEVRAAKQCYKNWFYRRANTKESERGFGVYEADWGEILERARQGTHDHFLIVLQILMHHFRNLSIRQLVQEKDRFELVTRAVDAFIHQKILKMPIGETVFTQPERVHDFPWETKLIQLPPALITSDNPSILSVLPSEERYGPFFLPVSPTELLVAIDKKRFHFVKSYGEMRDAFITNLHVAQQSTRFVYYHQLLPPAQRTDLWSKLESSRVTGAELGAFAPSGFQPTHPNWSEKLRFSFLENLP